MKIKFIISDMDFSYTIKTVLGLLEGRLSTCSMEGKDVLEIAEDLMSRAAVATTDISNVNSAFDFNGYSEVNLSYVLSVISFEAVDPTGSELELSYESF